MEMFDRFKYRSILDTEVLEVLEVTNENNIFLKGNKKRKNIRKSKKDDKGIFFLINIIGNVNSASVLHKESVLYTVL